MSNNTVLLDGAIGTNLWNMADDKKPVWHYNIENPEIVYKLHKQFVSAGSQIICTNTFGANAHSVFKSPYTVKQVVSQGVKLAKQAANNKAKVALDIGPLSELLEPYGELSEEDATAIFKEQIESGIAEKPDFVFLETFMDLEMLKIAAGVAAKYDVPLLLSMTFESIGKTIMGNSVEQMLESLARFKPLACGLNCSLEPSGALPVLNMFIKATNMPLIFKPNAGLPNLEKNGTLHSSSKEDFVNELIKIPKNREIYLGGCCGTTPDYIKLLSEKLG